MSNTGRPNLGFTALNIRIHINKMAVHQMFVTKDVLVYGTRAAVDMAMSRMVKKGAIMRLSRGVFMKICPEVKLVLPSVWEVARAKARAFGKKLFEHGADLAAKLGLPAVANAEPTYITDGPPTSFRYGEKRIYFKTAAPRKVNLAELNQGALINALWFPGQRRVNGRNLGDATRRIGREERHDLHSSMRFMPTWLSEYFCPMSKTA